MGIKALEGFSKYWYTPLGQDNDEDKTKFYLKPFNSEQLDYVLEGATYNDQGDLISLSPKGVKYGLKQGLRDWENFCDSTGEIKFKQSEFYRLPYQIRQGIVLDLVTKSIVSEDAEKNS